MNFILAFVLYIAVLYAWGEQYLPTANMKYGIVRAAGDGWLEVSSGEYRCEEVNGCLHFYDERGTDYPYSNLLEFDAVRREPAFRAHDYWIAGGTTDRVAQEIEDIIGIDAVGAVTCSAKSGLGVEDAGRNCEKVPPPQGDEDPNDVFRAALNMIQQCPVVPPRCC